MTTQAVPTAALGLGHFGCGRWDQRGWLQLADHRARFLQWSSQNPDGQEGSLPLLSHTLLHPEKLVGERETSIPARRTSWGENSTQCGGVPAFQATCLLIPRSVCQYPCQLPPTVVTQPGLALLWWWACPFHSSMGFLGVEGVYAVGREGFTVSKEQSTLVFIRRDESKCSSYHRRLTGEVRKWRLSH